MRAKYFLKGMGIGVTVTALIFTVAFALNPPTLSDEEVIARAKTLGMIESDETMENQEDIKEETAEDQTSEEEQTAEEERAEGSEEKSEEASEEVSEENVETEETEKEVSKEEALKALKELQDSEAKSEAAEKTPDNSEYKTTDTVNDNSEESSATGELKAFSVNNGEDSAVVSSRLYRQGIIDDPNAFDQYLTSPGYDTRIHPGTYNIPSGASYEAIANAITR